MSFKNYFNNKIEKLFRYLLREGEYSNTKKHTPKIENKKHNIIPFKAKLTSLERRVKAAREQKE
jgi:ribosomal protein S30